MTEQDLREHQYREFATQILEPAAIEKEKLKNEISRLTNRVYDYQYKIKTLEETNLLAGTFLGMFRQDSNATRLFIERHTWNNIEKFQCFLLPESPSLDKALGLIPVNPRPRFRAIWDDEKREATIISDQD